jgi:hypothetical protein
VKFKKAFLDTLPSLFERFLEIIKKSGGIGFEEDERKFDEIVHEFKKFYGDGFYDNW